MNAEKAAAEQQAAIDKAVADALTQAPTAPAAPTPAPADLMAQLQQLGEMKTQGLLSDEEFTSMKAKLVGA